LPRREDRLDEDVHLLADVDRSVVVPEPINDLQTRVSTRSMLSPVSDFFGTTYGSKRTNWSGF
jgi:hypothetical protein